MLRKAKLKDFNAIKQIFKYAFKEEYKQRGVDILNQIEKYQRFYPLLKLLELFPNPYQHIFTVYVYEKEDKVVGMVQISPKNKDLTHWNIDNIAVLPEYRGQGIGNQIINNLIEIYANRGVIRFTLEVDIKNKGAIKLYERLGFRHYCTIYYYKGEIDKNINTLEYEQLNSVYKLRKYNSSDSNKLFNLYQSSIPHEMKLIDTKTVKDFKESFVERFYNFLKKNLKHSNYIHLVVENPNNSNELLASLIIIAQYRNLPNIIRLTINPGYETLLTDDLLKYAINFLSSYPSKKVLIAGLENQKIKREIIEKYNFKLITADYMMVKDNLCTLKVNNKTNISNIDNASALKPSFLKKVRVLNLFKD